jgi:ATP-dependent DNA ligase
LVQSGASGVDGHGDLAGHEGRVGRQGAHPGTEGADPYNGIEDQLQQHRRSLGAGPRTLPGLVRQTPASYVAFDVLAVAGHDARSLPLSQRRALLEELARGWAPPLSLSPATTDPDEAAKWFEDLPHTGIEGLVIKGTDQPYTLGARSWLKLKHRETVEII